MKISGKIIKILANFYYVQDVENKVWECFARGRLLKEGKLLYVGDEVEIESTSPTQAVIVDLKDRKNKLDKPDVANVDQVLVMFSTCEPDFDFYNLDRYLSFVRFKLPQEEIIICINKTDLKEINVDEHYFKSGYKVFYVSALKKYGLDKLIPCLMNKTTVFTGPSGVGKSSLIKAYAPELNLKIGSISIGGKGKHITRNVELISITNNNEKGFLVDTPGFTQISFKTLNPHKLLATFNELTNIGCNFSNCLHNEEEGCKVEHLIKSNLISRGRLENYMKVLLESKTEIAYGTKEESTVKFIGKGEKGKKGKEKTVIPKIKQEIRAKSRKKEKQDILKFLDEDESL